MIVGIIQQKTPPTVMGVVELPDGVPYDTILENWVGLQGLPKESKINFMVNGCGVVPWSTLKKVWEPYQVPKIKWTKATSGGVPWKYLSDSQREEILTQFSSESILNPQSLENCNWIGKPDQG